MSAPSEGPRTREYSVHAVLGSGGFGKVYLARDRLAGEVERYAALKLLRIDAPLSYQERFRDEATILALLDHPSFVKVHALFRLDGRWCIDMDYVRGVTVHRLLDVHRGVPPAPALAICAQVAEALDLAWSLPGPTGEPLRVLHRDIKPSNLMITRSGVVKVLDFGIARWQSAPRRATPTETRLPGSVGYMAPERYGFKSDFGPEADVYALGVVLWELLVGEPYLPPGALPVEITAEPESFLEHAARRRELLTKRAPPEVVVLLSRMLAWDPPRRPSAAEVARQMQQLRVQIGDDGRGWLTREVTPLLEAKQLGEERDGLCGRVVRSDPLPDPTQRLTNTFLPMTGVQTEDPPSDSGGPRRLDAGPTSLAERARQSGIWVGLVIGLLLLGGLGSALLADGDGDGARARQDCDDQDPRRAPGLPEQCDDLDNDCDGQTDEDLPGVSLYVDADGDGFGAGEAQTGCLEARAGYASRPGDCDDQAADRRPGAAEILGNGLDDDCEPGTPDLEAEPARTAPKTSPRPTATASAPTTPSAPPVASPEPAAQMTTGQIKLAGSGVQAEILDKAGAAVGSLRAGGALSVPAGSYKATVRSGLISGVVLGPFTVSAGGSVLIDCSMPLMGQLCSIK